ncbi:MAG TPA: hypothetical protein VHW25_15490 [Steroidobacteraceae bacterium]|jgi:hypothetical protein|nr:hypothetical protein [Steroidobacteraceae bacterium]
MTGETRTGWNKPGWLAALAAGAMAAAMASQTALAADPCEGFTWNVAHERALFATAPAAVTAATAAGPAATLDVDKLYQIALTPQDKVNFVMAPAKKALADGAFAGMVTLHIPNPGKYRVSMSEGFWIDVIAGGKFAATNDFTGAHECRAPRKIVLYTLPAGDLTLQFSNTNSATVRVTVTAAPK